MSPFWIGISDLPKQDSLHEVTLVRTLWHVYREEIGSPPDASTSEPFQPR